MNQYGTGQNVPYAGQQESDLVNNPRYTGQSAGTNPLGHDGRGPAEESRYGAVPLNTNTGTNTGLGTHNSSTPWPSPAAPAHAHRSALAGVDQYGNPRKEGVVDKLKDAVGMGPNSGATGYNAQREQPGYGTPGYDNYGQPRNEGVVDKIKNAVGMGPNSGATGYDTRREQPGYGTPGYDNFGQPRNEGVVDKMKDAVGMGPNSGATGYNAQREQPGYGTSGYDNYGQPRNEGVVDKMKDAVGMGPNSGATGYDARREQPGYGTPGYDNYNQSGLGSEFGTHHHDGVHVVPGHIPVVGLGERRAEPGYDSSMGQHVHHHEGTTTGGPRKEGIVEKIKDTVGMGKHDNVGQTYSGTTTGTISPNTYGTGESGLGHHNTTSTFGSTPGVGMHHDNVGSAYSGSTYGTGETGLAHHNTPIGTPGSYSHHSMVDTGLGHERHPGSNTGYPHETLGERTEDVVGKPHHDNYERTGKGFDDTSALHDSRTETGYDATNVDYPGVGTEVDETDINYPHNDGSSGVGGAPPKKGMMAKIKEKLHH